MSNEAASCYFDINVFTDRYGWATLWLAHDIPQVYMGEWVKIRCIYKTEILNTYDWLIWIVFFSLLFWTLWIWPKEFIFLELADYSGNFQIHSNFL